MNFLVEGFKEVLEQGRRAAVDVAQSGSITRDSPYSPDVPEELIAIMPDLFDRFPLVFPWTRPQPVDPALHNVWIMDNTAFRTPQPGDKRPDLAKLQSVKEAKPTRIGEGGRNPESVRGGSGWEMEIVACYFIKNSGRDLSRVVAGVARALQISDDDVATKKRIAERVQPFVDTVLPKRTLRITIGGKEQRKQSVVRVPCIANAELTANRDLGTIIILGHLIGSTSVALLTGRKPFTFHISSSQHSATIRPPISDYPRRGAWLGHHK